MAQFQYLKFIGYVYAYGIWCVHKYSTWGHAYTVHEVTHLRTYKYV